MKLSLLFEQKKVHAWTPNMAGLAMIANKGSDQKAIIVDNKKTDRSRASNHENKDNL